MFIKILIEIGVKQVDNLFTYKVPDELVNDIMVGIRVKVPFNNRILEGFVMEICQNCNIDNVKEIISVIDKKVILTAEMLWLGNEISNQTLCSKISAYQVMLPKALKASIKTNMNIKKDRYAVLSWSKDEVNEYLSKCKYDGQNKILKSLIEEDKIFINALDSSINTLVKKGIVKFIYEEKYRYEAISFDKDKKVTLNSQQKKVVEEVSLSIGESNVFLLYGVTGSGKTEVYMNLVERVLSLGKSAIILVPEISLTTQIVSRFTDRFNSIAVLHSALSDSERYDEYRKISLGLVNIVIGTRSAIFAPLNNIGLIILDEEHTTSYKQDNHPKYHARDVAILRSEYHKCPVILGSATPTLESFARAGKGVYKLLTLTTRAGKGSLPIVNIIDMKKEAKNGNFILSNLLIKKIKEHIANKKQVLLLLNRRGYSSMFTCINCGNVEKCPNCDISLTYHKSSNTFKCHYCNYTKKKTDICSKCGSNEIKDYGVGTEKLVEELNKIIQARIVRMDVDTTSKKFSHEKIIREFANHEYDILVGTQMIAKGLDFPLVTLVGIINADSSLNIPDFRSSERTFQLLSQAAGRAGRSDSSGEVIIQTYNEKHYSLLYTKNHDYLGFYKKEMQIRKELKYSPYYFIILINIFSSSYELGSEHSIKVGKYLRNNLSKDTIILGPTVANIFKINNIYRYQCIIKYKQDDKLKEVLKFIDQKYKYETKVNIEIDVNPNKL